MTLFNELPLDILKIIAKDFDEKEIAKIRRLCKTTTSFTVVSGSKEWRSQVLKIMEHCDLLGEKVEGFNNLASIAITHLKTAQLSASNVSFNTKNAKKPAQPTANENYIKNLKKDIVDFFRTLNNEKHDINAFAKSVNKYHAALLNDIKTRGRTEGKEGERQLIQAAKDLSRVETYLTGMQIKISKLQVNLRSSFDKFDDEFNI